ncbi:MAG: diaminopimelate decarboxylase [Lachnospirales bacterium]
MEKLSKEMNFFKNNNANELMEKYGSPLYVYSEDILLERTREIKQLVDYDNFVVNYSAKANTSLGILQIIEKEGLHVDAMSPGEIFVEMEAGFTSDRIFYISNNVNEDELIFALEKGVIVSIDSLSQLEMIGNIHKKALVKGFDGGVCVRFNSGVGAGHHEKVVTGGKKTKFGINSEYLEDVKTIAKEYDLKIIGINQHIGSLFMDGESYIQGAKNMIDLAKEFPLIKFVDLGGGFGIPYNRKHGEKALDLKELGEILSKYINDFTKELGREIIFKVEPGRYIACECGVILGKVTSIKENSGVKYVGCDIGFNVLQRPVMYDSYHEIEIDSQDGELEKVTVVGNICESGDVLGKDRILPKASVGDVVTVYDAGAYGYTMASNYNQRLRPAEVLIRSNGEVVLLRKRDSFESLIENQFKINV